MNIFFACDIDNTLIYSYKKKKDDYICIEMNKGREQGFMSEYVYKNFIAMTEKVCFVPVTTRSIEQYNRICFPCGYVPEYALVSNGATLIHNGKTEKNWDLIKKDNNLKIMLDKIYNRYKNDKRFKTCRIVDDSYVYVYCADDTDISGITTEHTENITVEISGRKIYFFPGNLSKGNAVKKLDNIIKSDIIISAGDSFIDCTMLDISDVAVVPADFDIALKNKNIIKSDKEIFSDFVINYILANA